MIDKFIPSRDEQGIFETFSDLALCTLAITLVMLSLLATNIGQRINIQISENHKKSVKVVQKCGKRNCKMWGKPQFLFCFNWNREAVRLIT